MSKPQISTIDPISSMPMERMSIGQLVNNTLETIDISNSAQKASKKMRDKNISSLVVTDDYNTFSFFWK
jgi:CBS domain-containing protein